MDGTAPTPWVIHCDGSAIPNPGRMGLGAVLVAPDGTRHTLSQATHATGCNNEAELGALVMALNEARERGASALQVYSDSSILVEQLAGEAARPRIERLEPLYAAARALLKSFDQVRLQWIPRHRNGEADALARAAMGAPPKPSVHPSLRGLPRKKRRSPPPQA
ncbi:MAG: ribonuclease HI family protein [Pseudomonadota bacterium]